METDALTRENGRGDQDLIDYLEAFKYNRLEMVELEKDDRTLIIDALYDWKLKHAPN